MTLESSHEIVISNIKVQELMSSVAEVNMLQNSTWYTYQEANIGGLTNSTLSEEGFVLTVKNTGVNPWDAVLQTEGISLEKGTKYRISYTIKASKNWKYQPQCSSNSEKGDIWYGGSDPIEATSEFVTQSFEFTMNKETDSNSQFKFLVGKLDENSLEENETVKITIKDIKLVKIS